MIEACVPSVIGPEQSSPDRNCGLANQGQAFQRQIEPVQQAMAVSH
jgi:hypothetical protein